MSIKEVGGGAHEDPDGQQQAADAALAGHHGLPRERVDAQVAQSGWV